jgi:hypothetical protein
MNTFDEDPSTYNGHFEVDIVIDRPVKQVWKHFLNIGSWVTSHDIETIHGTPHTVGSITRVSFKKAKEFELPPAHHHYCKMIHLISERQWLLKTYSEKGGSYGMQMMGFDDGRVVDLGDKTKAIFGVFLEIKSEAVAKDPTGINLDVSRDGMIQNLANLKRMVESG